MIQKLKPGYDASIEIRFLRNQFLKRSSLIIFAMGRVPNFERMQILLRPLLTQWLTLML